MIAYLSGNFTYKSPALIHIEVNGIGYEVNISLNTYSKIQDLARGTLFTHLQIKEDGHTLFGFFDQSEKTMFIQLIGISGVGAATARMMLSAMKPAEIVQAIIVGNVRQLESIKGIGKKTAERIVLELKDKVARTTIENGNSALINNSLEQDALNALIALGIPRNAAESAIRKAQASVPHHSNLELLIKKALQSI